MHGSWCINTGGYPYFISLIRSIDGILQVVVGSGPALPGFAAGIRGVNIDNSGLGLCDHETTLDRQFIRIVAVKDRIGRVKENDYIMRPRI